MPRNICWPRMGGARKKNIASLQVKIRQYFRHLVVFHCPAPKTYFAEFSADAFRTKQHDFEKVVISSSFSQPSIYRLLRVVRRQADTRARMSTA